MPSSTPGPCLRTFRLSPASWAGRRRPVKKLNTFFTALNAGRDRPFDWAGNEPSLWTPWEYDYFGAPSRTQAVVRKIADDLYSDTPVNEPGNDDLGAISSWYVWAAIGMYPVTPGSADLALASPLFPDISMTLPNTSKKIVIHAPSASASAPYIHTLSVSGADVAPGDADLLPSGTASPSASSTNWEPAVAAVVDPVDRGNPDLRPVVGSRSRMGLGSGAEPALVTVGPVAGRGVLGPERGTLASTPAGPERSRSALQPAAPAVWPCSGAPPAARAG